MTTLQILNLVVGFVVTLTIFLGLAAVAWFIGERL